MNQRSYRQRVVNRQIINGCTSPTNTTLISLEADLKKYKNALIVLNKKFTSVKQEIAKGIKDGVLRRGLAHWANEISTVYTQLVTYSQPKYYRSEFLSESFSKIGSKIKRILEKIGKRI